jgi:hypothetical protein
MHSLLLIPASKEKRMPKLHVDLDPIRASTLGFSSSANMF